MKKFILFILILFLATCFYSQSPDKINYQVVVRSVVGNVITNTSVPVTLTITDGINSYVQGPTNLTTNNYGLLNIEIGPIVGSPSAIDWSSGSVQIISDINGVSGTSDLLSVPYALHANSVEGYPTTGISNGYILVWDSNSNSWVAQANSASTDDQNLTGATLTGTSLQIDIEDGASTTVDLAGLQDGTGTDDQNLSGATLTGTSLQIDIEDGGSTTVDLAGLQDGTGTDDQNLSGATLTGTSLQIDIEDGASTTVDLAGLQDGSGTDDQNIDTLGLNGTTLGISIEGGVGATVDLASLQEIGIDDLTDGSVGLNSGMGNVYLGLNAGTWSYLYAYYNTGVGEGALHGNEQGSYNTANGYNTLENNIDGRGNSAFGAEALFINWSGKYNSANGFRSLYSNTLGNSNVAIGVSALYNNTDRSNLVAIGDSALYNNGVGATQSYHAVYNTAIGSKALFTNTTGDENTATGFQSMYSNTSGYFNTANGVKSLYLNTEGNLNTAMGWTALYDNTTGNSNTAIGYSALLNNTTGYSNVAVGVRTLYNNTDRSNLVAIGDSALFNNGVGASGSWAAKGNTAIGSKALYSNTTGYWNTANGSRALYSNIDGNWNTANGEKALTSNTTGSSNTAFGRMALNSNIDGTANTATGSFSLFYNTTGNYNTANGFRALENSTGSNNIALGYRAGENITSGDNNIIIGYDIDAPSATGDGQLNIGNLIFGNGLDGIGSTLSSGNVGIGTSSPDSKLHVNNLSTSADAHLRIQDNGSTQFCVANNGNTALYFNNAPAYKLQLNVDDAAKPTSSAWTVASDQRLKTDVSLFHDGLNVLMQIKPVWFRYNGKAGMPTDKKGVGTIAQELQEIAPYMVSEWTFVEGSLDESESNVTEPRATTNYLGVNYGAMDFVLINSIQEQQTIIISQENRIDQQNERIEKLEQQLNEIKALVQK